MIKTDCPSSCGSPQDTAGAPRYRKISFRVSEDEYRQLRHLCRLHRASSVSALARIALKRLRKDQGTVIEQGDAVPRAIKALLDQIEATINTLSSFMQISCVIKSAK